MFDLSLFDLAIGCHLLKSLLVHGLYLLVELSKFSIDHDLVNLGLGILQVFDTDFVLIE